MKNESLKFNFALTNTTEIV